MPNRLLPEADFSSRVVGISAADIIGSLFISCVPTSMALRTDRGVKIRTLVLTIVFEQLLLLCCHMPLRLVLRLVGLVELVPGIWSTSFLHHLDAFTWLHHRENLGETLAVLNIDIASQRRFRLIFRQLKFI